MNPRILRAQEPLFIVGCVRSGTTMVRDLLRRQPNVICPEETQYFRISVPFRTPMYNGQVNAPLLKHHRKLDGMPDGDFQDLLNASHSRGELLFRHVSYMAKARGLGEFKWFDKTPQHVYGIPLIQAEFPKARFLHIVRNPLNVVASMKVGRVVKVQDPIAATNYWIEAVSLVRQMQRKLQGRLMQIRYEDVITDVPGRIGEVLAFSELGDRIDLYRRTDAHPERDQYKKVLSEKQKQIVARRCGKLAKQYGYDLSGYK